MAAPDVVVLDVNETLSDMRPLAGRIAEVGGPASLLDLWFASVLRDGIALSAAGQYAEFRALAVSDLQVLLRRAGGRGDLRSAAEHVVADFPELPVHADVGDGLRLLHGAGVRLVTMTNGSTSVTDAILGRAGLLPLIEHRLDVAAVGRWKPHPDAYGHALRIAGVGSAQAALLAVHPWDVAGAQQAGMTGAWLNRDGSVWPYQAPTEPQHQAGTLPELAERLLGRPAPLPLG